MKLQKHEDDLKPKDKKAESRAEVVITSGTPDNPNNMALIFILLFFPDLITSLLDKLHLLFDIFIVRKIRVVGKEIESIMPTEDDIH